MLDYVMSGDFWDHIFEFRGYSLINVWSCTAWCSILGFVGSAALSRGWEATLPAHWYSSGHDWSSLIIPLDVLNYSLQILCVGCTVGPWGLCGTERQCSHSFISGSLSKLWGINMKKSDSTDVITTIKYWLNFALTGPYWVNIKNVDTKNLQVIMWHLHGVIAAKEGQVMYGILYL